MSINIGGPDVRGSGNETTVTRDVTGFTGIQSDAVVDIVATSGPDFTVTLSGDNSLVGLISTEVVDDVLAVSCDRSFTAKNPITVTITAPAIDMVSTSGVGDVSLESASATDRLRLLANGVGTMTARGVAVTLVIEATGVGEVDVTDLTVDADTVTSSGVGNVAVGVSKTLDVSADGLGNVSYTGTPELSVSGSGLGQVSAR